MELLLTKETHYLVKDEQGVIVAGEGPGTVIVADEGTIMLPDVFVVSLFLTVFLFL